MGVKDKFAQAAKETGQGIQYATGSDVSRVHLQARDMDQLAFNLETSNTGAQSAGLIKRGLGVQKLTGTTEKEEKKRAQDFLTQMRMLSVQEQLRELSNLIDAMREQAKRLREEAVELRKEFEQGLPRMAELSGLIEKEEKFLKDYETTQKVNREAWVKFLKEQGKDVNNTTSSVELLKMMRKLREEHQEEYDGIKGKEELANEKDRQADKLDKLADEIHAKKQEIEKLPPQEQQKALEELWKNVPYEVIDEYTAQYKNIDHAGLVRKNDLEQSKLPTAKESSMSVLDDMDEDLPDNNETNKVIAPKLPGLSN